jgi:hypothetical protein
MVRFAGLFTVGPLADTAAIACAPSALRAAAVCTAAARDAAACGTASKPSEARARAGAFPRGASVVTVLPAPEVFTFSPPAATPSFRVGSAEAPLLEVEPWDEVGLLGG